MTGGSAQAPDVPLVLAPEVVLRLRSGGQVEISVEGRRLFAGTRVLGILEQFAQPTSMREFVRRLRASGMEEFIEGTSLAMQLRDEGVLVDATQPRPGVVKGSQEVSGGRAVRWVDQLQGLFKDLERASGEELAAWEPRYEFRYGGETFIHDARGARSPRRGMEPDLIVQLDDERVENLARDNFEAVLASADVSGRASHARLLKSLVLGLQGLKALDL
jgi:hypothetical protein